MLDKLEINFTLRNSDSESTEGSVCTSDAELMSDTSKAYFEESRRRKRQFLQASGKVKLSRKRPFSLPKVADQSEKKKKLPVSQGTFAEDGQGKG